MQIYIVGLDETGKAYPKEINVNDSISVEAYLENNYVEYYDWGYNYKNMVHKSELVNKGLLGKVMKCKQCGKYYILAQSNIAWYEKNGLDASKRCKFCRMKNRKKEIYKMLGGVLR